MDNISLHDRERHFHDSWGVNISPSEVMVDESFQAVTAPEGRLIVDWLFPVSGKKILDLGCGAGEGAVFFAKHGALVTAVDLSPAMLDVVERVAELHNVSVRTLCAAGEDIPLEDNQFDIVYAGNFLHHVSLSHALAEVHRLLKPGGHFVSWDPLKHNPIINVYRRLASDVRTVDEHPLSINDLDEFRRHFASVRYETTWLCTQWIFLRFFLIEGVNPHKERYWKKIIREHLRLEKHFRALESIDKQLLRTFPFLRRFCWNVIVLAEKAR